MPKKPDTVPWMVNNFPRRLKDAYMAFLRANGTTHRDYLEYLIAKVLRENGVDIPEFDLEALVVRLQQRRKHK